MKAPAISPISTGTHLRAAALRSAGRMIFISIRNSSEAATMPPNTGEITQLAAIFDKVTQFTSPNPAAAIPPPMTPPTMECVVDTGAFR